MSSEDSPSQPWPGPAQRCHARGYRGWPFAWTPSTALDALACQMDDDIHPVQAACVEPVGGRIPLNLVRVLRWPPDEANDPVAIGLDVLNERRTDEAIRGR